MIKFTKGNLLNIEAEALVNTVNTVGIMGKGIALMFKEAFPDNFAAYARACDAGEVSVGKVHIFEREGFLNPRFIVNFPTKKHWRQPSKIEWIEDGLRDLRQLIIEKHIKSIALPPLGAGNGKLDWPDVKARIIATLSDLEDIDITVFEPTDRYQNVSKRAGVDKLTPARAVVAELVRRYWVLGIECTMMEVQKLAWFAERVIVARGIQNVLNLQFVQNRYGPYAHRLSHMLDALDGSYLHCEKRIADASPGDIVWFEYGKADQLAAFLKSVGREVLPIIDETECLIEGFQSPLGLELLSTIDWITNVDGVPATLDSVRNAVRRWPGGPGSAERKAKLFNDRLIELALTRLSSVTSTGSQLPEVVH
jgi:O-acetyl-ADP-ribose deacetylase (regulator of RNase III)